MVQWFPLLECLPLLAVDHWSSIGFRPIITVRLPSLPPDALGRFPPYIQMPIDRTRIFAAI